MRRQARRRSGCGPVGEGPRAAAAAACGPRGPATGPQLLPKLLHCVCIVLSLGCPSVTSAAAAQLPCIAETLWPPRARNHDSRLRCPGPTHTTACRPLPPRNSRSLLQSPSLRWWPTSCGLAPATIPAASGGWSAGWWSGSQPALSPPAAGYWLPTGLLPARCPPALIDCSA